MTTQADLESIIAWLRDCAARTARENGADLRSVYPQLKIINTLAREILALKAVWT